jgi:hypothetical protein
MVAVAMEIHKAAIHLVEIHQMVVVVVVAAELPMLVVEF